VDTHVLHRALAEPLPLRAHHYVHRRCSHPAGPHSFYFCFCRNGQTSRRSNHSFSDILTQWLGQMAIKAPFTMPDWVSSTSAAYGVFRDKAAQVERKRKRVSAWLHRRYLRPVGVTGTKRLKLIGKANECTALPVCTWSPHALAIKSMDHT
jgi:hypothetical protein